MPTWNHLEAARVVRLNAVLNPNPFDEALYHQYHLRPNLVEPTTETELIASVEDCDALFVVSAGLSRRVIEQLNQCKIISRLGIGTDKIDVATATRRGIIVTNVPYFCVEEQADHTMTLILALERRLPQLTRAMAQGSWSWARRESQTFRRFSTLTLGLVGFGNSARATARRARAFGMRVIATRRNMKAAGDEAKALGVAMVDLDTVLRESDYVSLHLPLTAETFHLLDESALRTMKPHACLINTSRGAIVDEMALVKLLRSGAIAGAGLDTFEHIDVFTTDERPPDHPLLELDNVILTPHVAAHSVQAMYDVARGGVENLVAVLSGHWPKPEHVVNVGVQPWFPLSAYDPTIFEPA
jgi:D-3-phosphoglycerate dehydrogenase